MARNSNLAFIFCLLFCPMSFGGQESHGGDQDALQFVKIGRVINHILSTNERAWKFVIGEKDLEKKALAWAIDNTLISTGTKVYTPNGAAIPFADGEIVYRDGIHYYVNKELWGKEECRDKFEEVFHWYLKRIYEENRSSVSDNSHEISSRILKFVPKGRVCEKLYSWPTPISKGYVKLPVPEQIHTLADTLVSMLSFYPNWVGTKAIEQIQKDKILLNQIPIVKTFNPLPDITLLREKVIVTKDFNELSDDSSVSSSYYKFFPDVDWLTQNIELMARENYPWEKKSQGPKMVVDVDRWNNLMTYEKIELLLHEYLGLITSADLYYRISSTLFLLFQ